MGIESVDVEAAPVALPDSPSSSQHALSYGLRGPTESTPGIVLCSALGIIGAGKAPVANDLITMWLPSLGGVANPRRGSHHASGPPRSSRPIPRTRRRRYRSTRGTASYCMKVSDFGKSPFADSSFSSQCVLWPRARVHGPAVRQEKQP